MRHRHEPAVARLATVGGDRSSHLALAVEGVSKRYGDFTALSGVDLRIAPGEIVALLGANGAGKTTLLSIAAGLCRPEAGEVRVDGIDMLAQPSRGRRRLGIATQETGIYPTLSALENLRFFGELVGLKRAALAQRIDQVADAFGLVDLLDRQARLLSAGQARRLHTAMILLRRPPLLLLDEPTTGVDTATRARMLELVRGMASDGSAICYSTHYLVEAEQLKANVAIIHSGQVVARGSLAELVGAYGQSAVELRFDGPPPSLADICSAQSNGTTLRLAIDHEPEVYLATLLSSLGDSAKRLRAVKLTQPNLESVFRHLTEQERLKPNHDQGEVRNGFHP